MNASEQVAAAEKRLAAAHLNLDLAVIESLLHDEYVILQHGGRIETKRDVITSYQSGARVWSRAEVDELDVRLYGNCARVVGKWVATGVNDSTPFSYVARFVSIWTRESGSWQNIAYSSTELDG